MELTQTSGLSGGTSSALERNQGSDANPPWALSTGELALWAFLATVTMLFAAFASAYLVRRTGADWQPIDLPGILWFNTMVLLSSSGTMELARRRRERFNGWLAITTWLGIIFFVGQGLGWRQLAAHGVYLSTNPQGSFFYVLTGLHGLHLAGGILFLGHALNRAARAHSDGRDDAALHGVATYWHFLAALWIGLLVLLSAL
ncbi:MAG: cytochrome c oxidase subunit 3 [Verrucomicrobia bacterium]|nr:cytochrome c oxidase subunit 3 [Verrucomicrobiota bacterium]